MKQRYSKGEFTSVPNKSARRGLPPSEQVVLMWLADHSDDDEQCYPSRQTLSEECGMNIRTLDRSLLSLVERGLIRKTARFSQNRQVSNIYETLITSPDPDVHGESVTGGGDKFDTGGATNCALGGATNCAHRTQPIKNSTQLTQSKVEVQKNIRQVFDFFVKTFERNENQYKLSDLRKRKIAVRLKDAGLDMLLKAIKNASEDSFYSGDNDRGWCADLDYIVRSFENVEKLANLVPRQGKQSDELNLSAGAWA